MNIKKKVLLIVPAYNEEESIENTIESIRKFKNKLKENEIFLDYIVVNDGSKDNTASIAKNIGVKLINLRTNLGLTGGFMAGMKYADRKKYDYAIQFDADGQHLPEYIPSLIEASEKGANLVVGSRFVDEKRPVSLRMLGSIMISFAIKITTGKTRSEEHTSELQSP